MPVLDNARQEKFAQEVAKGMPASRAYVIAGYAPKAAESNASVLMGNHKVRSRIQEICDAAAKNVGITKERVLREMARVGFADIRKAVKWTSLITETEDEDDSTGVPRIVKTTNNSVEVIPSDEIDDDTAAAIAAISQDASGGLKIKFHNKHAALLAIGKELGMFKDQVEHSGTVTLEMLVNESMGPKTIEHEPAEPEHDLLEGL